VPLRHSLVGRTPIHAFQAVIRPGLPLAAMAEAERDEALVRIAETILDALERSDSGGTDQPGPTDSTPRESSPTSSPPQPPTFSSPPPRPADEPPASKDQGALASRMISCATARIGAQGKDQQGEERWRSQPRTVTLTVFEEALGDGVPLELVETPAGSFLMGSPPGEEGRDIYAAWPDSLKKGLAVEGVDVEAQRRIYLPAFLMGRHLITQAQWRVVVGWPRQERELDPEPSHFLGDQRPVEQVSWHDAVEFCHRLSLHTGPSGHTPAEPAVPNPSTSAPPSARSWPTTPPPSPMERARRGSSGSRPAMWGASPPTPGACTTCTATLLSGASIAGIPPWRKDPLTAAPGRSRRWRCRRVIGIAGCCAAAPGPTSPGSAARPTGAAATRTASATMVGSASAVSPQDCLVSPQALTPSGFFLPFSQGCCHEGQHLPMSAVGLGLLAVGARAGGSPNFRGVFNPLSERSIRRARCFGAMKLCRVIPCLPHAAERNPADPPCRSGPRETVGCSPETMAALIDVRLT
jgi:hypothetical protein